MTQFSISRDSEAIRPEIIYMLKTWAKNQDTEIAVTEGSADSVTVGVGHDNIINIPVAFDFSLAPRWNERGFIQDDNGRPDYLSTAFYLMNSIQEHNDDDPDELKRFRYVNSRQFKTNSIKENIVQRCFDEVTRLVKKQPLVRKSKFFLSHDIDMVNGAIVEDGFNVLKRGRIDIFLKLLFHVAIGRPDWLNMDKIMKIESEYDCKSVFFWIVNKGRLNRRERNADYTFDSNRIQRQFRSVAGNGFENGLHKSISDETFSQEFAKFGSQPFSNRYHYLKFRLPDAYHNIEQSKLKMDASLGFAEEAGFRNSYGLPFNPFNRESRTAFSFVETPLHVMDRTYFQYKKYSPEKAKADIFDFFERNSINCVISILWHNNFFTDYKFKGYLDLYKSILQYIKDKGFETTSQEEIVKNYSIS